MVRMEERAADASEAARSLANPRWGGRGVIRSANVVVERVDELPDEVRARVHETIIEAADRILVRLTPPDGEPLTLVLTADQARQLCNQIGAAIHAAVIKSREAMM